MVRAPLRTVGTWAVRIVGAVAVCVVSLVVVFGRNPVDDHTTCTHPPLEAAVTRYLERANLDSDRARAHLQDTALLRNRILRCEAAAAYDAAAQGDPADAATHQTLAVALERLGCGAGAIAGYSEAISCSPQDANLWLALADALRWDSEAAEGIEVCARAAALEPSNQRFLWSLEEALVRDGRFLEAVVVGQRLLDEFDLTPEQRAGTLLGLGWNLQVGGHYTTAAEAYRAVMDLGYYEEYVTDDLKQVQELISGQAEVLGPGQVRYSDGSIVSDRRAFEADRREVERQFASGPQDGPAHRQMGREFWHDQPNAALRHLRTARALNPDDEIAYYWMMRAFYAKGEPGYALVVGEEARHLGLPGWRVYLETLKTVYPRAISHALYHALHNDE